MYSVNGNDFAYLTWSAHLKRILRLRGPNSVKDKFHLAATAQNFRKLAKLIPTTPKAA